MIDTREISAHDWHGRPHRHFYPTPAWLVLGLLVVEGLLWLSERSPWPTWRKGYAVPIAVAAMGVVFVVSQDRPSKESYAAWNRARAMVRFFR